MKVNSTGLGKTTLSADLVDFTTASSDKIAGQYEGNEKSSLMVSVESTKPVHWTIRITMDGKDVRKFVWMSLKPKIIFRALKLFVIGNKFE